MQKKLEETRYKNNRQVRQEDRTYYLVKITQDIDIRSHRIHALPGFSLGLCGELKRSKNCEMGRRRGSVVETKKQ